MSMTCRSHGKARTTGWADHRESAAGGPPRNAGGRGGLCRVSGVVRCRLCHGAVLVVDGGNTLQKIKG